MKNLIPDAANVPVPKLTDVRLVSDGWLKKYVLTYQLENGETFEYESVSRKGLEDYRATLAANAAGEEPRTDAVCIVPILPDDSILLIREFRYPVNAWVIAFPAGLIEAGETLDECIDRELREETGYRVRTDLEGNAIIPLPQSGHSSVGMTEENVRVVIAYVEPDGEAQLSDHELIQVFPLAREDAGRFLDENRDLIGTRCQLLLESVRRTNVLRKRLELAQHPITSRDYA